MTCPSCGYGKAECYDAWRGQYICGQCGHRFTV